VGRPQEQKGETTMLIGNFRCDWKRGTFIGEIRTLTIHREHVLFRSFDKCSKDDPDYLIVEEGHLGHYELGAAWEHEDKDGKEFLSVHLYDPILGIEIEAVLDFIDDELALLSCPPPKGRAKAHKLF
jgi:uncharacterized protein (DUF736 family)